MKGWIDYRIICEICKKEYTNWEQFKLHYQSHGLILN